MVWFLLWELFSVCKRPVSSTFVPLGWIKRANQKSARSNRFVPPQVRQFKHQLTDNAAVEPSVISSFLLMFLLLFFITRHDYRRVWKSLSHIDQVGFFLERWRKSELESHAAKDTHIGTMIDKLIQDRFGYTSNNLPQLDTHVHMLRKLVIQHQGKSSSHLSCV